MSTSLQTELPHTELFEPTRVGSIEVKNHYAMGPMGPLGFATPEGGWNQRAIEFYATRARGGVGLIITGVCQVTNPADGVPPGLIPNPTQSPGLFMTTSRDLTERVHGYDAKIVLQAGAGFGRVITKAILGGRTPVAPSAIPYRWDPSITCREMTVEEIQASSSNSASPERSRARPDSTAFKCTPSTRLSARPIRHLILQSPYR
ncbi:hypothetical protein [Actinomyces ruminis]|uniref:oxidoreductase n=1 Tax=Actinomyces ruminis TaxID=1937003 RepID=UPI001C558ECA|nr:hypothetical protein [Actinomyces ruminis]